MKEYQTKNGLTRKIYSAQKQSCIRRGHELPKYTMLELRVWIFEQPNFNTLYNEWVESGFKRDLVPSIDRLDDNQTYSFTNIRLVAWHTNNQKARNQIMSGVKNHGCTPILQMDLDGNVIQKHHSQNSASRKTGVNLGNLGKVVRGEQKTAGGFKWAYAK